MRSNNSGKRRQQDQRPQPSFRRKAKESRTCGRRQGKQIRPLPKIVEQQTGHHQCKPRNADRLNPKVPHIGVQCFNPSHRKHD
ncbi:Uncharacterised protein [Vibrio cholerae]|nr:Uncharacterised protein [Vibrio cholerae]CSC21384.1 Uncharacterised protein [Vibrio cholerae]CSC44613.1 Uncharacterised protein [Vibrio cholerae]CSD08848.1 Uncharacterised protein [Vibrio cholerae]